MWNCPPDVAAFGDTLQNQLAERGIKCFSFQHSFNIDKFSSSKQHSHPFSFLSLTLRANHIRAYQFKCLSMRYFNNKR